MSAPSLELSTERAVLGALLLAPDRLPEVAELRLDELVEQRSQIILRELRNLHDQGVEIDFVSLGQHLKAKALLQAAGGAEHLCELSQSVTTSAALPTHLRILREDARQRRIKDLAQRVLDSGDPEQVASELAEALQHNESAAGRLPLGAVSAADVQEKTVEWLVPGMIPRGMLTMLAGPGGLGKSSVALDLAARLSVGGSLFGHNLPLGSSLIISCEEDLASVVKPKLRAAEADQSKIDLVGEAPVFPDDAEALRSAVRRRPDLLLIIVDTIGDVLGRAEENSNSQVRQVLGPLRSIAEEFNVAVVCIAHLRKDRNGPLTSRLLGSVAMVNFARSVLAVLKDGETDGGRVLATVKSNYAQVTEECQRFTLGGSPLRVTWTGPVQRTEAELLATLEAPANARPRDAAQEVVQELLRSGPMESKEVERLTGAAGITKATLRRAVAALGVKPFRVAFGGPWMMRLPALEDAHLAPEPESEHLRRTAPKTEDAHFRTVEASEHLRAPAQATDADLEAQHLAALPPAQHEEYRRAVADRRAHGHPEPCRVSFREVRDRIAL